MNCKERLTIKYDGAFVPKELCTIDRNGDADDCEDCGNTCNEHYFDNCEGCPIQKCFDRLGELEDKLENGTLIELPCKLGTKVFEMNSYYDCKIDAFCECPDFSLRGKKACIRCENNTKKNVVITFYFNLNMRDRIGKTVFLTKEEAEQKLKEAE